MTTRLEWRYGGKTVQVAGSFDNWKTKHDMSQVGDVFYVNLNLEPGLYEYKFIVDGLWVYDLTNPTKDDGQGNVNNYLTVMKNESKKIKKQDDGSSTPTRDNHQQQTQGSSATPSKALPLKEATPSKEVQQPALKKKKKQCVIS